MPADNALKPVPGVNDQLLPGAGVSTVVLEGAIDPGVVTALQRWIGAALDAGEHRIVVDLRAVTLLGAQTMSLFCATLRRLTRGRAVLAIVGAPPAVARVLELCAISGVELYPSVRDALSARPPSV